MDRYQRAIELLGPNATPDAIAALQNLAGIATPKLNPVRTVKPLQPAEDQATVAEEYTGGELGPNGEALPEGATAYNKYGEPYFGDENVTPGFANDLQQAIKNYFAGVGYRMTKGVEEAVPLDEGLSDEQKAEVKDTGLTRAGLVGGAAYAVKNFDTISTVASNLVHNFENAPMGLHFITRGVSELVKGALNLVNQPAIIAKRGIGTAYGLAKGDPLDEAYESARLTYSAWIQPAIRDEFIRRYRAGENPVLLAAELENPIAEAIGEAVLDPLNLIGLLTVGNKAARATAAAKAMAVVDDTSDLGRVMNEAGNIQDAAEAAKLVQPKIADAVNVVRSSLTDYAQEVGAFAPTANAKISHVTDLFHNTAEAVLPTLPKDEVADTLMAWATLASGKADDAARTWATGIVLRNPASKVLLSDDGLRAGVAFSDYLLDDAGKLSQAKVARLRKVVELAQQAENPKAALIEGMEKLVSGTIKDMFPSVRQRAALLPKIQEKLAKGEDLPKNWQRFVKDGQIVEVSDTVQWLDKVGRKLDSVVKPINGFLGRIYMGTNAPYFFRNLTQNFGQTAMDDFGAAFASAKKSEQYLNDIDMMGAGALRGIGGGPAATIEGLDNKGITTFASRAASQDEQRWAYRIYASTVKRTFRDLSKHIWKDPEPILKQAGFTPEQIAELYERVVKSGGNIDKALAGLREGKQSLAVLGPDLLKTLENNDLYDEILDIRATSLTPDEAAKRIDDLVAERQAVADRSFAEEVVPDPENNEYGAEVLETVKIMEEEELPKEAGDLLNRRLMIAGEEKKALRDGAVDSMQLIAINHAKDNPQLVQSTADAWKQLEKQVGVLGKTEHDEAREALAVVRQATKDAKERQDWDAYHQLWDEWMNVGGTRDKIHVKYRKQIEEQYEGFYKAIEQTQPAPQSVLDARQWVKTNAQWDNVDEQRFIREGKAYPKGGAKQLKGQPEKVEVLPDEDTLAIADFDRMRAGDTLDDTQRVDDFVKRHATSDELRRLYPQTREKYTKLRDAFLNGDYRAWPQRIRDHLRTWAEQRLQEIEDARAGRRIFVEGETGSDLQVIPEGSTFPEWYHRLTSKNRESIVSALEDLTGRKFTDKGKSSLHGELLTMAWNDLFDDADTYYYPLNEIAVGDIGAARAYVDKKMAEGFNFLTQYEQHNDTQAIDAILKLLDEDPSPEALEQLRGSIFGRVAAGNNAKPLQVPSGATPPTPARMMAETLDGVKFTLEKVKDALKQTWDLSAQGLTAQQETALKQWQAAVAPRWTEARAIALRRADAARKFTLLDYNDKRGIDLALSYLFPYQFWYSRTYANWMTRLARDPWIAASYAKYRAALEKEHAGMPDWWKYNINTNELLGLDSENPLYFNLEATLNPLNGITGVDFDDPDRQRTTFSSMVDGIGKFGPSVWTPISLAMGLAFYLQDDPDAGSAWIGRTIPVTQQIKNATNLLGIRGNSKVLTPGGVELDPGILLQGGLSKHDRKRVGRVLATMDAPQEQIVDAAYKQSGPLWEQAWTEMEAQRMVGNLGSFFGVGMKGRTQSDIQIDQFYAEMNGLYSRNPDLSGEEYREAWNALEEKYPFMDALLLARKSDGLRDTALAYNVLGRIPPGQNGAFAEYAGIDERLIDKFYADKGITKWEQSDQERFMAGIRDLGAVLAEPPDTLRRDWNQAKQRYNRLNTVAAQQWGVDILDKVDTYFCLKDAGADNYLASHPEVSEYQDWKAQQILSDPILREYYGGIDFYEKMLKRQMYAEADKRFGANIAEIEKQYYAIKDDGGDTARFKRDHPELDQYWDFKNEYKLTIAEKLEQAASLFPEKPQAIVRTDAKTQSIGAMDVLAGVEEESSDVDLDAVVASYRQKTYASDFSLTEYIETEAEKIWPGIVELDEQFERLSASNTAAAQAMYQQYPQLRQYAQWEKSLRAQYNAAQKGQFAGQAMDWQAFLDNDALYRIVKDGNVPYEIKRQLEPYANRLGVSVDVLIELISA